MSDPAAAERLVLATRAVSVAALLGLVALGLAWETWLAPTGRGTLALKVLPLAAGLAGLLKLRLYTYRWMSLAVWLYVAEGLVRATSGQGLEVPLAWAEAGGALLLFVACATHVRVRLRNARAAA